MKPNVVSAKVLKQALSNNTLKKQTTAYVTHSTQPSVAQSKAEQLVKDNIPLLFRVQFAAQASLEEVPAHWSS